MHSNISVFYDHTQAIQLKKVIIPELGTNEILVKNEYTTLCRSDIYTFSGKRKEPCPTTLGHEIVGRIEAFGDGHPRLDARGDILEVGDRVSWAIFASDPEDALSQKGIPQKATDLFKYGHQQISEEGLLHGGLGQHTILRQHTPLAKLEDSVPKEVAALINCSVATIAGAMRLAGDVSGKKVCISGTGMLGIIACAMAKSSGAESVTALDPDPQRVERARSFGADHGLVLDAEINQNIERIFSTTQAFDIIFEISGKASAMENSLDFLAIGGSAIWVGATYPEPAMQIDGEKVVRKLLTIKGLHNYNHEDFTRAVDFIEAHHASFPFVNLVHGGFDLQSVNEAFAYAMKENPFRVGVEID